MTGRIVHVGHGCQPPDRSEHTVGTVWECGTCRRWWQLVHNIGAHPKWQVMSFGDRFALGLRRSLAESDRRDAARRRDAELTRGTTESTPPAQDR